MAEWQAIIRSIAVAGAALLVLGCGGRGPSEHRGDSRATDSAATVGAPEDSATRVRAFTREMAGLLLDSHLYEMRATLAVKRVNPDPHDESPLRDEIVTSGPAPGPHTMDGKVYAEIDVLQAILAPGGARKIEGDRVYVGNPEVLVLGHRHGDALFVPVKLYARQFGAYVDVGGTMGTMATIWTPEILRYAKRVGLNQSAGLLEGYAEGIVDSVNVRADPGN